MKIKLSLVFEGNKLTLEAEADAEAMKPYGNGNSGYTPLDRRCIEMMEVTTMLFESHDSMLSKATRHEIRKFMTNVKAIAVLPEEPLKADHICRILPNRKLEDKSVKE